MGVIVPFRPKQFNVLQPETATTPVEYTDSMRVLERMLTSIFDDHANEAGVIEGLNKSLRKEARKATFTLIQGGR